MKNIYLVGMPGSGKSRLGKVIAEKLGRVLIDTDEEITKSAGRSPEDIISLYGEARLRSLETGLMERITGETGLIVSTGGGLPAWHDHMRLMNDSGITVYIHYAPEILWARIKDDRSRPLSSSLLDVQNLLAARIQVYEKSHIIVQGVQNFEENAAGVLRAILAYTSDVL